MFTKEFAVEIAVTTAIYFALCTASSMYKERKQNRHDRKIADLQNVATEK